jgi:hypothetical protein
MKELTCACVAQVASGAMNGARVSTADGSTYDFMAATVFRAGDLDIYRALLSRIPLAPAPTQVRFAAKSLTRVARPKEAVRFTEGVAC